jgi:Protein of unknown function (DUF1638)
MAGTGTLVLACGALGREIVALKRQLGLSDAEVTLQCLPAELHNRPREIAPRVDEVLSARRREFDRVLVGYGDCGTGGALDAVLAACRMPTATNSLPGRCSSPKSSRPSSAASF